MPKDIMVRTAADNAYLHKDFHGALSTGIEYIHNRYGEEAVREYLRQFTRAYYAPLTEAIRERGLPALREHLERIYALEGGEMAITETEDELLLCAAFSPAVQHMRAHGYKVARLFHETVKTVNETLCEGTPFAAELIEYDPETGRSAQRFYRR
jgi:hypothetical protein